MASALSWHDGFPVDGTSTLSRYFDDRPFRAALWFQAAGDTRGQSWTGLFRDADDNGVMEFGDLSVRPSPLRLWTPELNFLSWRNAERPDRERHPGRHAASASRFSGARPTIRSMPKPAKIPIAIRSLACASFLLHQLDPTGTRQPADDVEVIAQSVGCGLSV